VLLLQCYYCTARTASSKIKIGQHNAALPSHKNIYIDLKINACSDRAYQFMRATSVLLSCEAFHMCPASLLSEPGIQAVSRAE
jgi:hypothetical protein